MLRTLYHLFYKKLRLSEPWNYKAPFLVSIPYLLLFTGNVPFSNALPAMLCSFCTIAGIAGFGYLSNDVADRTADARAGIPNGTLHLSAWQIIALFGILLAAAILPWIFYFPVTGFSIALLAAEFLLFILYAAPPFRLKERGIWGIVTDALYAHANPALLAAYTFYLLSGKNYGDFNLLLVALVGWQFFLGLRNILQHQLLDMHNDLAAGSKTYAVKIGGQKAFWLMKYVFVPLEILFFLLYITVASFAVPLLAVVWLLFFIITALVITRRWKQPLFSPLHDRLYLFMDDFRLKWLPLVFLAMLCISELSMLLLLVLHVTLFNNGLAPLLKKSLFRFRTAIVKRR